MTGVRLQSRQRLARYTRVETPFAAGVSQEFESGRSALACIPTPGITLPRALTQQQQAHLPLACHRHTTCGELYPVQTKSLYSTLLLRPGGISPGLIAKPSLPSANRIAFHDPSLVARYAVRFIHYQWQCALLPVKKTALPRLCARSTSRDRGLGWMMGMG